MEVRKVWESPDGRITKEIISFGEGWPKPYENSVCKIRITNVSEDLLEELDQSRVVIGENDSEFGYLLELCLCMMSRNEIATITFHKLKSPPFTLHLIDFEHNGYVYQWSASKKYNLALSHKTKGLELFNENLFASSRRFGKALKLLCSIPIEVDRPPSEIDGVSVSDVVNLKAVLYNNLGSCFLKNKEYEQVLHLCKKTLTVDARNVKALYRCGVAYSEVHLYEEAHEMFKRLLEVDPDNKVASEKLAFVNVQLQEDTARVNAIIKKMFLA